MSAFTFEPGDPSVGIFGESWYHDCEDGDGTEAIEFPVATLDRSHGETDFWTILACEDCGATRLIVVRDYTGWDQPEDYEAAWLDAAHA